MAVPAAPVAVGPSAPGGHRQGGRRRGAAVGAILLLLRGHGAAACTDDGEGLQHFLRDFAPAVTAGDCAAALEQGLCADADRGPLVRVYCPVSCGSCPTRPAPESAERIACANYDYDLRSAYRSCDAARVDCQHAALGAFVRKVCPVTCGICGAAHVRWAVDNVVCAGAKADSMATAALAAAGTSSLLGQLPQGFTPEHMRFDIQPCASDSGLNVSTIAGIPRNLTAQEVRNRLLAGVPELEESMSKGAGAIAGLLAVRENNDLPVSVDVMIGAVQDPPVSEPVLPERVNCTDDDQGLRDYATAAHLDLRGCLDVVLTLEREPGPILLSTLKLPAAGYCDHAIYGPAVRYSCPASCSLCTRQVEPITPAVTGELLHSVPDYDLEVRPRTVEFYITVGGVDYPALQEAQSLRDLFREAVAEAIVDEADKIVMEQVSMTTDYTTRMTFVLVHPMDEDQARYVHAQLNNSRTIEGTLKAKLSGQQMVSLRLLDESERRQAIVVEDVSRPYVTPPFEPSLMTCAAQSWTASSYEAVEYYVEQLSGPQYGFAECQQKCAEKPGGRLLSCIKSRQNYEFIRDDVLKGQHSVWVGLLQPFPSAADEPVGDWTWVSQCAGYNGFWFEGGDGVPKQPDNGAWWVAQGNAARAENCAALVTGFAGAELEAFDIPCSVTGRGDDVKDWIPDRCLCETASKSSMKIPMCTHCRPMMLDPATACMYESFGCTGIGPGESCSVSCKAPFVGTETVLARCPAGNSNPFRMLRWEKPLVCGCPEVQPVQGYLKSESGHWMCADGYAGIPEVKCPCGVAPYLTGCKLQQPCAVPAVDRCRIDVSDCETPRSRFAGSACMVKCRSDPTKWASARCPSGNTDATSELEFNPLPCTLDICADPSPAPEGYNLTSRGWECAAGYIGTVQRECFPSETAWTYPTCTTVAKLSGCLRMRNCGPPPITAEQGCRIDVSGCQSVEPGAACEISCRFPFEGLKTSAFCPEGNTDPEGLVLNKTLPTCTVVQAECDKVEPATLPAAYTKLLSGWACATSYTGAAEKTCVPNPPSCALEPVLSGCAQIKPCEYTNSDCQYDIYNCLKVQPGDTCEIGCKAPYTGVATKASCSSTNDVVDGLRLLEGLPKCVVMGCSDPNPVPEGYMRTVEGWACADGFTDAGTGVKKHCEPSENGDCSSKATLSGCVKVAPCKPLVIENACWLDISACGRVQAGKSCPIKCRIGWMGSDGSATCPMGNVDPEKAMDVNAPECFCEDPNPVPAGYQWDKDIKEWLCSPGYAGKAVKRCLPGPNCTTTPVLEGCYVPAPCEVSLWQDAGSSKDRLRGTLRFGPAKVGDSIDESEVLSYEIYFANAECQRLGRSVATVRKLSTALTCCKADVYTVSIDDVVELGATRLAIVAVTARGVAPDGGIVDMADIFGAFQDKVEFRFTIVGIDYPALLELPTAQEELERNIREAVANEAGDGVHPAHVTLEMLPGSVVVAVTIKPPYPVTAPDVQFTLSRNPSALSVALKAAVLRSASLVETGLMVGGLITIASLSRPVVITEHGGRMSTGAAPRRAPLVGPLLALLLPLAALAGLRPWGAGRPAR